jgi:predicted pyridoxine 5'-phosphate oxidase superfamily flavin-nucleotide-binding protein
MSVIATIEQLVAIYGQPNDASTVKVADRITPSYRVLIEKSPFAALATSGRKVSIARRAAICQASCAFTTTRH